MTRRAELPVEKVVNAYQAGQSVRMIAERWGVSQHVITRRLTEAGVQRRSRADAATVGAARRVAESVRERIWAKGRHDALKAARQRVLAEHVELVARYYREELARRSCPAAPRAAVTNRWREIVAASEPAAKLPSARVIAAEMGVSEATADLALTPLRREGLVISRGRAGRYVAGTPQPAPGAVGVALGPKIRAGLRALVDQIEDGMFKPGDRLPSAKMLAEHLDVSRATAGAVLAALVAVGWATSLRGSYTYLVDPLPARQGLLLIAMTNSDA